MPRLIVIFRALIRPVFICGVGWWDFMYFTAAQPWTPEQAALLKAINLIVLIFWFGERAMVRTGFLDMLKIKGKGE